MAQQMIEVGRARLVLLDASKKANIPFHTLKDPAEIDPVSVDCDWFLRVCCPYHGVAVPDITFFTGARKRGLVLHLHEKHFDKQTDHDRRVRLLHVYLLLADVMTPADFAVLQDSIDAESNLYTRVHRARTELMARSV